MVRCVTFEIRWHDTLPIYSCAFQPIAPTRLAKILDHNLGQGLPPGRALAGDGSEAATETQAPVLAGGASWRLATAGGDNNVRIWIIHPQIPSPAALAAAGKAAAHPPRAEYAATLSRHTGVVNVVRFSPHGDVIASAGDDGVVLFWVRRDIQRPGFGEDQASSDPQLQYEKEAWRVRLLSRASSQELYDMAWSKNGDALVVGGTDFAVRIINPADGSVIREISDHQHYVQGVAWDPLNEFIATQSSDRAVHIYTILRAQNEAFKNAKLISRNSTVGSTELNEKTKNSNSSSEQPETLESVQNVETRSVTPRKEAQISGEPRFESESSQSSLLPKILPADSARLKALHGPKPPPSTTSRLYGDDRYSSFFRRLAFSPDGALLATPTGIFATYESEQQSSNTSSAVFLYARGNFRQSHSPIAALPGHKTATVAAAFSPILYQLRTSYYQDRASETTASQETGKSRSTTNDDPPQLFKLPYRMVYAVATQESVWVYDTQQSTPICCLSNLHYASFTDLTWSPDGQVLMMSSTDGYCSIAIFDYNELGQPYHYALQPSLQRLCRQEASIPQNDHVNASENPISQAASKEESSASILPKTSTDPTPKAQSSIPLASQDHNDIPNPASASIPSSSPQPKKKRRVALTFEGPLPP
ncbi:Chromatin assembly factor 1 subunit [Malassezia yamatoensis]|uniref:Chromatin assembly factor 1 subunit n=1 Tax=Malassezia yamatoensis TaxID=253288 RepID=A0AAJ5YRX0_9BASI|nr:Chromatin assembly factor 1 subunit [Malassezia yamatoensis]